MKRKLFLLFTLSLVFSCGEEQNFDQFDDLQIEPTAASSIFYFESDEATINATGSGVFYQEIFTFEAFSDPNIADRVIDGTITYQIENTTSKPLSLLIEFLDAGGNVLDSEPFIVNEEPTALLERQVAYGDGGKSLDILRNTTNIRVSGENLGDATSQSSQNEPKVILRSSAAFRIRLR